jgi:hypothetical protein
MDLWKKIEAEIQAKRIEMWKQLALNQQALAEKRRCHNPAIGTERKVSYRFSLEPRTKSSQFFGLPHRPALAAPAKALKMLRIRA